MRVQFVFLFSRLAVPVCGPIPASSSLHALVSLGKTLNPKLSLTAVQAVDEWYEIEKVLYIEALYESVCECDMC